MYSIQHLNLITSSFCDLKCSYCFLRKNKSFRQFDTIIREKWLDGSYIDNVEKVFKKLECDPKDVEVLSLWGGEPFLHLKIISNQFKRLMQLCPNMESIIVPTNWVHTNVQDLCNLLQIINDNINERTINNKKLHFHIQASIDGIENDIFIKNGHTASWNQYRKNYNDLCDILEKMSLSNVSVHFCISSTGLQQDFIERFSKIENIKEHIQFWSQEIQSLVNRSNKIKTVDVEVNSRVNFPTIAIPQQTSSLEALEIVKIIKTISQTLYNEKAYYHTNDQIVKLFFNCETDWPLCRPNHECPESSQRAVTLLPDGTICQCPDGFIEHTQEFQNEFLEEKDYKEYKNMLIASRQFFNPLTATDKEIADHKWYNIMGGFKDTFFPYFSLGYATATELALSHQIDEIYLKDPMLLFKHLTAAGMINECFRDSCEVTGVPYMGGHDLIRRWFNGYVQEAYNYHLSDIKWTIKKGIENEIKEREK